ncbi:hypothetical protein [Arthrobacter sp. NyZ413]|uniref:hypothetical protein n=1 Tax=Arthrobacter sp. NyZ413 TaxID=3144669 RepID=UPI003BF89CD1
MINIGSIEGISANPDLTAYSASRAGLHGMTKGPSRRRRPTQHPAQRDSTAYIAQYRPAARVYRFSCTSRHIVEYRCTSFAIDGGTRNA